MPNICFRFSTFSDDSHNGFEDCDGVNADANDDHDACQVHQNSFYANEENVASHHHHDHLCQQAVCIIWRVAGRPGRD